LDFAAVGLKGFPNLAAFWLSFFLCFWIVRMVSYFSASIIRCMIGMMGCSVRVRGCDFVENLAKEGDGEGGTERVSRGGRKDRKNSWEFWVM